MACQAHAVACIPCQAHVLERHYSQTNYHKSFQAPIGWFIKRLLGAFVKAVSRHVKPLLWHALCPCFGMSSRIVACLVKPMSWDALSRHVEPVSRHALSSRCRAMSSRCCGMPCAHVLACQAVSWHPLSSPCPGMHALSSPSRGMCSLNYFLLCSFKNPNCSQLLPKCFQVPKSQRPKSPRALVP